MNDDVSLFIIFMIFVVMLMTLGGLFGSIIAQPEQVTYKKSKCLVYENLLYCHNPETDIEFKWETE